MYYNYLLTKPKYTKVIQKINKFKFKIIIIVIVIF